ncbi:hypothetical protein VTO42DRAFT_7968 [Malbranchea cinnamomea]
MLDALLLYSSRLDLRDPGSLTGLTILSTALFLLWTVLSNRSPFLLINEKKPFEVLSVHARRRFLRDARSMIESGLSKANVFRIESDNGIKTVLAPKYANELRSHPQLNFGASVAREFHAYLPAFAPFKQGTSSEEIFQDAVRTKLTQSLGLLTEPLSAETSVVLEKVWTNDADWHDIPLKQTILRIVAQLSSRVFLGDLICRNPDWLRITVDYTVDSFLAAQDLRLWPRPTRWIVAPFLASYRKIQQELDEARAIITPVLEERRAAKEAVIRAGNKPPRYNDAMQWMEECAKGRPYDPAIAQLGFSLAAIHTTSDMLTQVLLDLCERQELIQELRREVITVLQEEGWKKTALYKLKLMDSTLKESQRLKPIAIGTMRRLTEKDITLSDGTVIPKGTALFVPNSKMWDPTVYPDPHTFDPYRFLKMREMPGRETASHLVSPSPEHMGFGFGKHACPGRFFAANEVKIALCHILLKYDIRLAEGYTPVVRKNGLSLLADPLAKIAIRRRQEEISL